MTLKSGIASLLLFVSWTAMAQDSSDPLYFESRMKIMHAACLGNDSAKSPRLVLAVSETGSLILSSDLIASMAYHQAESTYADNVLSRSANLQITKQYLAELGNTSFPCAKVTRLNARFESVGKDAINLFHTGLTSQTTQINNFLPDQKFLELYASCNSAFALRKNYLNGGDEKSTFEYFSKVTGRELAVNETEVRNLAETLGRTLINTLEPKECSEIDRIEYRVGNAIRLIDDIVRANIVKAKFTVR